MDVDSETIQTLKVDSNLEYYTSNKNEELLRLSGQLIFKSIKCLKMYNIEICVFCILVVQYV